MKSRKISLGNFCAQLATTSLIRVKNILPILLLIMASSGYAIEITTLEVSPHTIDLTDKFYATVGLEGETCGIGINFLFDNKSFSSKLLGCEREEISSGVWDLKDNPVDCGIHILTAELKKNNEILDQFSKEIQIGNIPSLMITPEKPIVNDDITFKLIDNRTNEPLSYTKVKIYNTRNPETKDEYRTDSSGEIKFRPKETGEYRIILDDPVYCGSLSFYAKRIMTVIGPIPPNPMEGGTITMVVPSGVGVKILDSSGNVYLRGSTSLGGGLNLTIDKAGNYTIAIGDVSSEYWGKNISLYISKRPMLNVDITPSTITLGKSITITVTSNGTLIDGATVDILPPNGIAEPQRVTSSYGKVGYTPLSTGKYEITVQKKDYSKAIKEFLVSGQLSIIPNPEQPREDEEFSVIVRDSEGIALSGANVYINGKLSLTDSDGIAKFKLPAGGYEILAEKIGYNSDKKKIDVLGILIIRLSSPQIELGENTEISVFDSKSNKISAEITALRPDGTSEIIQENYTPETSGGYEISASKAGYALVSTTLKVKPLPLNLTTNIKGGELLIKVNSHGDPVKDIEISLDTPSGVKDKIRTDENGMASWEIREEGIITITLNSGNANRDYEGKIITQQILKKEYTLLWFLPIIVLIVAIAIFIYNKRFRKKGRGMYERSANSSLSKI